MEILVRQAIRLLGPALAGLCLTFGNALFLQAQSPKFHSILRGENAVKQLKEKNQYDLLRQAVTKTLQEKSIENNKNTPEAAGQKVTGSDGAANDQFGYSVALSGDTAIVGAYNDDSGRGSAYVFVRSGVTWSQQQKLVASDGVAGDNFGWSVAISGDTAIVGAYFDNIGSNDDQGSAYVFTRSGSTWTEQQKLTAASGGTAFDNFGISVAVSGDTAVIGANNSLSRTYRGSAYVFTRSGAAWTQQTQLTASDAENYEFFGSSVAIDGDTAIIGAWQDSLGGNFAQGSAYIFTRSGATWTEQQKLTAADGATEDYFGVSVSISGETVIIGAHQHDIGMNSNQGAAYVFTRSGTTWSQQQKLTASGGGAEDQFGISVSVSGNTAVVGANWDDVGMNTNQGSAYVFERSASTWTQKSQLLDSSGAANDEFGFSVAISGDKIIVGAPYADTTPLTGFSRKTDARSNSSAIATDQGAGVFFVNAQATAATVFLGGRVLMPSGAGLSNAVVYLTSQKGETRVTRTSSLGYYRFDDILAGETYIISAASKSYAVAPQAVTVSEEILDLNFIAEPKN